ncbi:MAG: NUDIX domain-containing protein [Oscillospiraceae bacterium]|nr:NUDIX domain-containing protein [Oscillospiraceae bacterium]
MELKKSIDKMVAAIVDIISSENPAVYLYGSAVLNDFRLGWSDIDILVLTEKQISAEQAEKLLYMRQVLSQKEPENPHYRLFEGGILSLNAFLNDTADTVVYWGTSGERITQHYAFNSLCRAQLLDNGILLYGNDIRAQIKRPSYDDIRADVELHYETIRKYGSKTGKSLYSFGWLLDISRCIFTLRTGEIIAKTDAAGWALKNGLCPVTDALQTALQVRNDPEAFSKDANLKNYAENLGEAIQKYADELERELYRIPHKVLGERDEALTYISRSGAYLIPVCDGKIAVVQTEKGLFLLGGGYEEGESDAECIQREVLEEAGLASTPGSFLCSAESYTSHYILGAFHPIQSYYAGTLGEKICEPKETDHKLIWLSPEELKGRLYADLQNWAIEVYTNV